MGSGKYRNEAIKNAQKIVDEAQANGKAWTTNPNKAHVNDVYDDISAMKQFKARSPEDWRIIDAATVKSRPGFHKPRTGMGGYEGERGRMTRQEFVDKLTSHDAARRKLQAAAAYNTMLRTEREALSESAPGLGRQLDERLSQQLGHQGPLGRWVNQQFDRALAPWMGKNSARKIVNATTSVLWNLKIAAGSLY